ncbi:hypothetical protein CapIbe_002575 [Capra ibex]
MPNYIYMANRCCCVQLFCNFLDCSPPGSSVHGILQARIHPDPEIKPGSSVLQMRKLGDYRESHRISLWEHLQCLP